MVFRGHFEKGTVIVDEPADVPDGTMVEIRVIPLAKSAERPWLKYLGAIDDLPPDASQRVDEILYGRPDE